MPTCNVFTVRLQFLWNVGRSLTLLIFTKFVIIHRNSLKTVYKTMRAKDLAYPFGLKLTVLFLNDDILLGSKSFQHLTIPQNIHS